MIGYVTIGTKDMEKAKAFWIELLEPLGAKILMDMDRIALMGPAMDQPMLAVCTPRLPMACTGEAQTCLGMATFAPTRTILFCSGLVNPTFTASCIPGD